MIDYSKLRKSLSHLELQYSNYLTSQNRTGLSDLDKEAIAESCIQRFEVCYDCTLKVLKRYLIETLGIPPTCRTVRNQFSGWRMKTSFLRAQLRLG